MLAFARSRIAHLLAPARILILFVTSVALPVTATAANCTAPEFRAFEAPTVPAAGWPINVNNQLQLRYPAAPASAAFAADNFLALTFADGARAVISLRDAAELARNQPTASARLPQQYWRNVFTGADSEGCEVAQAMDLADQDYRVSLAPGGMQIYAYGKGDRHQFFAIPDNPQHPVVNGLFRGVTRAQVESVLATITKGEN